MYDGLGLVVNCKNTAVALVLELLEELRNKCDDLRCYCENYSCSEIIRGETSRRDLSKSYCCT